MTLQRVLVAVGVLIAAVVSLIGFDLITTDNTHVLGWGFLGVVLIGIAILL